MKLIENGSPITDVEVIEHVRTYRLLGMGIVPPVAEEIPAVKLDWLLKINEAVGERHRKAMANGG